MILFIRDTPLTLFCICVVPVTNASYNINHTNNKFNTIFRVWSQIQLRIVFNRNNKKIYINVSKEYQESIWAVILLNCTFKMGTSLIVKNLLPEGANSLL